MVKIIPKEHDEQVELVARIKYEFRLDNSFIPRLFGSIPNGAFLGGGSRGGRHLVMAKLKAEGLNTGLPDLVYLQPRGAWPYLAIEMKRINASNHANMDLSEDQQEFKKESETAGAFYILGVGADFAFKYFCDYMSLPPSIPGPRATRGNYDGREH